MVGYHNGAPIRIKDMGDAIQDVENNQIGGYVFRRQGQPEDKALSDSQASACCWCSSSPAPTSSTRSTEINKALPGLAGQYPARHQHPHSCMIAPRPSAPRCSDVEISLLITIVLVVAVIFLFLRNVRATLIPSVCHPVGAVGHHGDHAGAAFQPRQPVPDGHVSIAVGFVVDDAIVMVEVIWQTDRGGRDAASRRRWKAPRKSPSPS